MIVELPYTSLVLRCGKDCLVYIYCDKKVVSIDSPAVWMFRRIAEQDNSRVGGPKETFVVILQMNGTAGTTITMSI